MWIDAIWTYAGKQLYGRYQWNWNRHAYCLQVDGIGEFWTYDRPEWGNWSLKT